MAEYIEKKELRFCEITEAVIGPHNFPILKHIKVDDIPPADVRENIHGEWVSHKLENEDMSIDKDTCSVCGVTFTEIARTGGENYNFCPNCGADMR